MDEQPPVLNTNRKLRPLPIIILAILILALLIIGGTLIRHHYHSTNHKAANVSKSQVTQRPSTVTKNPTSTPSSTNSATSGVSSANQPNSSQLNDAGPGQTIAIFVGTVILTSGIHQLYLRHRLHKIDSR